MFGTLMFTSKLLMEWLPNVHLIGLFVMLFTLLFRKKALISIYLFVLLTGIYAGFAFWWIPYLYIWTVLWLVTMLLPKDMPKIAALVIYPAVCCLHGLFFGVLYAPTQALLFGFNLKQTITWIITGLPFDIIHAISNLLVGTLIYPLYTVLRKIIK